MHFFSLAIVAASASAIVVPDPPSPTLSIIDFTAGCVPHSAFCDYGFGVTSQLGTIPPDTCFAHVLLGVLEKLPRVVDQNDCKVGTTNTINYNWQWSIDRNIDGGLHFRVWYPMNSRSNFTFCYDIPPAELVIDVQNNDRVEHYIGCGNFTMYTCPDC